MRMGWRLVLGSLLGALSIACTAGPPPAAPSGGASTEAPRRSDRTLLIAVRTEPFSVAPRALEGGGVGLDFTIRLFNAGLELIDDKGNVSPYMA
jgi:hypothetical protein